MFAPKSEVFYTCSFQCQGQVHPKFSCTDATIVFVNKSRTLNSAVQKSQSLLNSWTYKMNQNETSCIFLFLHRRLDFFYHVKVGHYIQMSIDHFLCHLIFHVWTFMFTGGCRGVSSTKNDTTYWIPKREGLLADAPNLARILVKHVARMMAIVCYIMFEYLNMSMSYIHGLGFSQEPWPASKCCQIHQTVGVWPCPHPKLQSSLFTFWHPQALNKSARLGIQLATTLVRFPPTSGAICQLPLYPPHPWIAAIQLTPPLGPPCRIWKPWHGPGDRHGEVSRWAVSKKTETFGMVQCHPKKSTNVSWKGTILWGFFLNFIDQP